MHVSAVGKDRAKAGHWVDVPRTLHQDHPSWIPPIRKDALQFVDPQRNPLRGQAEFEHFVLYNGSKPIGRIAATVHTAYIDRHQEKLGYFGFLDAPVDRDCFALLLNAAEKWLAERGMAKIAGPYNYWSGQEMGLLVKGFDERPTVFQTWNPPGYRELIESLGYSLRVDLTSYRMTMEDLDQLETRIQRINSRLSTSESTLTVRSMRKSHVIEDLELIRVLFNKSFADNSEVVDYEKDVFEKLVHPVRKLLDPELILFVYDGTTPVGMMFMTPDLNAIMTVADGAIRLRDYFKLSKAQKRIDTAVVLVMGLLPDAPPSAGALLVTETAAALRRSRYNTLETTWVHEKNKAFARMLRSQSSTRDHKMWVLLEKEVFS
jgi:hypothetical protein